jgi:hypothetical protein
MVPTYGKKIIGKYLKQLHNISMECICTKRIVALENEILEIKEQLKETNKLNKELHESIKSLTNKQQLPQKGGMCSISGNNYEKTIYNVTSKCLLSGSNKPFNTQDVNTLGGSSSKNDIICNYKDTGDIGIEAKKYNAPDWMQCSIKFNTETKQWEASKGKNPEKCREIFNSLVNGLDLYGGEVPPFMMKDMTHEEWTQTKKETGKWKDAYVDIPPETIRNLYAAKGCQYIQVSDGYGLYHLGDDVCGFDVPIFDVDQQLRVRTKIHSRKNSKGFCSLSVTVACQPKDLKKLNMLSPYSLDDKKKLPSLLLYKDENEENESGKE